MSGGKGTTFDGDLLKLILNATPIANIADNASSAPLTNLYVALHTGDPTAALDQTHLEAAYPGYARVAIARNNGSPAWTITGASASPNAAINFPISTGSPSETETWASVGVASSGASKILYRGPLSVSIVVNAAGITPQITTATALTEA